MKPTFDVQVLKVIFLTNCQRQFPLLFLVEEPIALLDYELQEGQAEPNDEENNLHSP